MMVASLLAPAHFPLYDFFSITGPSTMIGVADPVRAFARLTYPIPPYAAMAAKRMAVQKRSIFVAVRDFNILSFVRCWINLIAMNHGGKNAIKAMYAIFSEESLISVETTPPVSNKNIGVYGIHRAHPSLAWSFSISRPLRKRSKKIFHLKVEKEVKLAGEVAARIFHHRSRIFNRFATPLRGAKRSKKSLLL